MSDNTTVAVPTDHSAPPRDVLACLTPLGWRGGLIAIILGLTASFFAFGYFAVY